MLSLLCLVSSGCRESSEISDENLDRILNLIEDNLPGLPEDYPEDVPVFPGMRGVHYSDLMGTQSLIGYVEELPEDVVSRYETMFFEMGWAVDEEE